MSRWDPDSPFAFIKLAGLVGLTTFGIISYYKTRRTWRLRRIEQNDARFAVEPLIMAERQRRYEVPDLVYPKYQKPVQYGLMYKYSTMKYWRKLRDEENELMKNVRHWKTGTLYGEPVYYSPRGRFVEPSFTEYYAHTDSKSAAYHRNEARKH